MIRLNSKKEIEDMRLEFKMKKTRNRGINLATGTNPSFMTGLFSSKEFMGTNSSSKGRTRMTNVSN